MTGGVALLGISLAIVAPPVVPAGLAMLGVWTFVTGIMVVRWQRAREDAQRFISTTEMHTEMEEAARQAMLAIGETLNDQMERAGHGRPIIFDRISYH